MNTSPRLGTVLADPDAHKVLNVLLPGNSSWEAYIQEGGNCLETCPAFKNCKSGGPHNVCRSDWEASVCNQATLGVIRHCLNNFKHYVPDDNSLGTNTEAVIGPLRDRVAQLLIELDEGVEEGSPEVKTHVVRERASHALARKLKTEAATKGEVICNGCQVDFFSKLGQLSTAVMDAHHITPLKKTGSTRALLHKANLRKATQNPAVAMPRPPSEDDPAL